MWHVYVSWPFRAAHGERVRLATCIHACVSIYVPGELDLEDAGAAQLDGLAGLRHGTERRPAEVEVRLVQARAAGALVRDHHSHGVTRAGSVTRALHLYTYTAKMS
jgi:hypothetical protein